LKEYVHHQLRLVLPLNLKPTYEGLKVTEVTQEDAGIFHLKPTYEGLKVAQLVEAIAKIFI